MLNLPDLELSVHKTSEWVVNRVVGDRFSFGRVFLAGDAAHRHVPTNGLGLNSAVHDSHNLAWKLAAVLQGRATSDLLDSYEAERRPADIRNADWALFTFFNHHMIDAGLGISPMAPPEANAATLTAYLSDTAMGRALRARAYEVLQTQRTEYGALDIELGYVYENGAIIADGTAPPEPDAMGCTYEPLARPGHRLPYAWLDGHDGRRSTHDLTGASARFVLIVGPDGEAWRRAVSRLADEDSMPLLAVSVGVGCEYTAVGGHWSDQAGIRPDGAILVRPDNHVAFRAASRVADPEAVLRSALGRILGAAVSGDRTAALA
jgi:2,4-dichlorophenol 6-monooxygenase